MTSWPRYTQFVRGRDGRGGGGWSRRLYLEVGEHHPGVTGRGEQVVRAGREPGAANLPAVHAECLQQTVASDVVQAEVVQALGEDLHGNVTVTFQSMAG